MIAVELAFHLSRQGKSALQLGDIVVSVLPHWTYHTWKELSSCTPL